MDWEDERQLWLDDTKWLQRSWWINEQNPHLDASTATGWTPPSRTQARGRGRGEMMAVAMDESTAASLGTRTTTYPAWTFPTAPTAFVRWKQLWALGGAATAKSCSSRGLIRPTQSRISATGMHTECTALRGRNESSARLGV